MMPKHLYLGLAVIGTALPLWQVAPFLRDHGFSAAAFFDQLFSTPVAAFFGMDVIVSSVALWVFVAIEGPRDRVRRLWVPVVANLTVGVSLGLPLFLYMREVRREMASAAR